MSPELLESLKLLGSKEVLESIVMYSTVLGLFIAASGLFYNAQQIRLSRLIAKSEFKLHLDELFIAFTEIDARLKYGRYGFGPIEKLNEKEWYQVNRYIGRLETLNILINDKMIDIDTVDISYSHRIVPLAMNPEIRKDIFEYSFSERNFIELIHKLEKKAAYRELARQYEERRLMTKPPI